MLHRCWECGNYSQEGDVVLDRFWYQVIRIIEMRNWLSVLGDRVQIPVGEKKFPLTWYAISFSFNGLFNLTFPNTCSIHYKWERRKHKKGIKKLKYATSLLKRGRTRSRTPPVFRETHEQSWKIFNYLHFHCFQRVSSCQKFLGQIESDFVLHISTLFLILEYNQSNSKKIDVLLDPQSRQVPSGLILEKNWKTQQNLLMFSFARSLSIYTLYIFRH